MRIGALFAGYGGLDMAVSEVLDAHMAWYSEVDKGALKVLRHRFPDVPNVGDVTAVDWSQVEPVDVLTGGSPCQDLSHAGKRQGMTDGTRSNLWVAMREAIAQLRPGLVVWENVRGAGSAEATSDLEFCPGCMGDPWYRGTTLRALGRVVGDLSDLGYVGQIRGLRAADVGAPHGRFRYFLAATDARSGGGREGSFLRTGPRAATHGGEASGTSGHRLLGTDAALLSTPQARDYKGVPGDGFNTACLARDVALLPTPTPTDVTRGGGKSRSGARSGEALLNGIDRLLPTPRVTQAGYADDGRGGKSLDVEARSSRWGDYATAITRWEHTLGRPAPDPTITSAKGNPQLAPAFVEWMMGLPAGWVTDVPGITRNEALKALGNGVVPSQAAAALRLMLASEVSAA